jgi:hypothetical protein
MFRFPAVSRYDARQHPEPFGSMKSDIRCNAKAFFSQICPQ